MPIEIEWRDGQSGPIVICDHCDRRIDDVLDGNAQWREPVGPPWAEGRRTLLFTHKACYNAFSRVDNPKQPGEWTWHSQELRAFMWFLTHNVKYDDEAAEEIAMFAAGRG